MEPGALTQRAAASLPEEHFGENSIVLDVREHHIQYMVPPHSLVRGEMLLSGGAVIFGTFCGRLICSKGSVIIKKGAIFEGEIEADQVWVDGEIRALSSGTASLLNLLGASTPAAGKSAAASLARLYPSKPATGGMSRLVGRQQIGVSNAALGKADVASQSFAIHGRDFAARYLPLG